MAKTEPLSDEITRKYLATLRSYLEQGNEAALHGAYEIGRRCLADGWSILDMISVHHQAIQEAGNSDTTVTVRKAGEFFTECMSPFEMTHRAIGEANLALRRLNEALEEQVRVISRELHDQSGQLLAAVHIELDDIARDLPAGTRARLQGIKDLCDQVEARLRDVSHELRPTILEDLGLIAALESLSERIGKRTGLHITIPRFEGPRLPARVEVVLYRVVQEALNNVIKHAGATSVKISVCRTQKAAKCSVVDNGIGFDPKELNTDSGRRGLGLLGIRERLQALEGEVQIESRLGQGTTLKILIPLEG